MKGWGLSVSLLSLWKVSRSYPFLNFWANGEINCTKNIQSINSLVHVTSVCDDWPRSVLLWLALGVALVLLCCAANQYCLIVGDRVKNIAIALCDRSPNSGAKHGQTKSTKNVQFSKITHLLCYIFVSCFMLKLPNIFRKKTVQKMYILYFR